MPVPESAEGTPRRALLGGLVALAALAACTNGTPSPVPQPAPTAAHPLAGTLADTYSLLRQYDATVVAVPELAARLQPLRADTAAHVTAINNAMGGGTPPAVPAASGPPTPVPGGAAEALAALHAAETAGHQAAADACLRAPDILAGLLASIAACRATHVEALQ